MFNTLLIGFTNDLIYRLDDEEAEANEVLPLLSGHCRKIIESLVEVEEIDVSKVTEDCKTEIRMIKDLYRGSLYLSVYVYIKLGMDMSTFKA